MPRRLNSVNQGGHHVEAIDVVESELAAVISMLGITDAQESETARRQIHALLETLKTARQNLLDYCRLDTLAMVRIVDRLRGLVG